MKATRKFATIAVAVAMAVGLAGPAFAKSKADTFGECTKTMKECCADAGGSYSSGTDSQGRHWELCVIEEDPQPQSSRPSYANQGGSYTVSDPGPSKPPSRPSQATAPRANQRAQG